MEQNAGKMNTVSWTRTRRSTSFQDYNTKCEIAHNTYIRSSLIYVYISTMRIDDATKSSRFDKMRVSWPQVNFHIFSFFRWTHWETESIDTNLAGTPLAGLTKPVGVRGRELEPFTDKRFPETLLCLLDEGVFPVVLIAVLRGIRLTLVESSEMKWIKT